MAEGLVVKAGGRVVKNVAGYDMTKMHIGAIGTLGVILQASLKVAPLPKVTRTLSARSSDFAQLEQIGWIVARSGLPCTGLAIWAPAGREPGLLMRFAGARSAVDRSCKEVNRIAAEAGLSCDDASDSAWVEVASAQSSAAVVLRVSGHRGMGLARAREGLGRLAPDLLEFPDAMLLYATLDSLPDSSHEAIEELGLWYEDDGGAMVIEAAPPKAKEAIGVWGGRLDQSSLPRDLKRVMDPKSTLSPGRYLKGL
jgi:glycolate oxidase FAD binding subunit